METMIYYVVIVAVVLFISVDGYKETKRRNARIRKQFKAKSNVWTEFSE